MLNTSYVVLRSLCWEKLLPILGIEIPTSALPCTVRCPLCQEHSLDIYQDTTRWGQWHHCRRCQSAGDLVELSARYWQIGEQEALERLVRLNILDGETITQERQTEYLEQILAPRREAENFWQEASAELPAAPDDLRAFRMPFTLAVGGDVSRWKERGGQFIGAAKRATVENILWPNLGNRVNLFSRKRPNWTHAWVSPLRDLPGRISGFMLVAGEHVVCQSIGHYRSHVREPGLVAMEVLDRSDPRFGPIAFVMLDPVVTLRLQITHLSQPGNTLPLPVVGLHADSPPCDYLRDHRANRPIIFWADRLTARLLVHARAAGGLIAVENSTETGLDRASRNGAVVWLQKLQKRAKPWHVVLGESIATKQDSEITDILGQLNLHQDEINRVLESCSKLGREKLLASITSFGRHRRVHINKQAVVETPRGWVLERTGEIISAAIIRLDTVIHQPRLGKTVYQGRILFREHEVGFTVSKKTFDKAPLKWVSDYLVKHGISPLANYNQRWERSVMNVIRQFSETKVVHGLDGYGWDQLTRKFVFPRYMIGQDGIATEHSLQQPKLSHLPAGNLPFPSNLTSVDRDALASCPVVWAVAGCVLHNLLARWWNYPTRGIAFINGGKTVARVAESLGCAWIDQYHREGVKAVRRYQELEALGWPPVLSPRPRGELWAEWLSQEGRNCLLTDMEEIPAAVGRASRTWIVGRCHGSLRVSSTVLQSALKIIPGVVQYVSLHPERPDVHGNLAKAFHCLTSWWLDQGGERSSIEAGRKLIDTDGQVAAVTELATRLIKEGRITSFNLEEINDTLTSLRWPQLNIPVVIAALARAGFTSTQSGPSPECWEKASQKIGKAAKVHAE